jgi:hypothetical protein
VLAVLHEERFQDRSPAAVQATLLDEGRYLCSTRTMYRTYLRRDRNIMEDLGYELSVPYRVGQNSQWTLHRVTGPGLK